MTINEIIEYFSKIPNIYSDLAQPSVKKAGEALETVFDYAGSLLLPLKLQSEKNKIIFSKRLDEFTKKVMNIPDNKICKIPPEIGIPIMEKFTFITDDDIADLFTTLLAKASSMDTINQAHPGFVQIIERLSGDEAIIIKYLNNNIGFIPFIDINGHISDSSFVKLVEKITTLPLEVNMIFPKNINAYLSNFISMGIFDIPFGVHKTDDGIYNTILNRHNITDYVNIYNNHNKYEKIDITKGYFNITDYGQLFIKACNNK